MSLTPGAEGDDDALLTPPAVPGGEGVASSHEALSTAPPVSQALADPDPPADDEVPDFVPVEFDDRAWQDLEGLLFLGKLTEQFRWMGHNYEIKTLDGDALLEVGLLHAKYLNTLADEKAYQMLMVAACCTRVDGQAIALPMSRDETEIESRFNVVKQWFPWVFDEVYQRYMVLEERVTLTLQRMTDAVGKVEGSDGTPRLSTSSV